jgi:hypothetical protein
LFLPVLLVLTILIFLPIILISLALPILLVFPLLLILLILLNVALRKPVANKSKGLSIKSICQNDPSKSNETKAQPIPLLIPNIEKDDLIVLVSR